MRAILAALICGAFALAMTITTSPARASAGVSCLAEDATLVLSLGAAFGRALGAGIASFGATLAIRLPQAPPDLRALRFGQGELAQSWWYDKSLNFALHREREAGLNGSVDLIIETTRHASEENRYDGHYRLLIAPAPDGAGPIGTSQEWRGPVTCSVD